MQTLFRALRSLRRSPAVSAVVVLSIGSALGLSTSLLAVIDSVTHPIVPFSAPKRLYTVFPYRATANQPGPTALRQLETLRTLDGIESVSASYPAIYRVKVNDRIVQGVGFTSRTAMGFFEMLGARPRLGRLPDGQEIADERAVLVSDELWRRAFNNRESIGDANIEMNGHLYAVVGVMPPHTMLPQWRVELWLPMNSNQSMARRADAQFVLRLREGVTRSQLEAKLAGVARSFAPSASAVRGAFTFTVTSVEPDPLHMRDYQGGIVAVAICVLLIACLNASALLLARGIARRRDYAMRLALGATHRDVVTEIVVEVVVLTLVGSAIGVGLSMSALGVLAARVPAEITWIGLDAPQWSVRVFGAAGAAVGLAVLVASLLPAWLGGSTDIAETLKGGSPTLTSPLQTRFKVLVVSELALAMVALVCASLLNGATQGLGAYDFGYSARNLLDVGVMEPLPPKSMRPESLLSNLTQSTVTRVLAVPSVQSAGIYRRHNALLEEVVSDISSGSPLMIHLPRGFLFVDEGFLPTLNIPLAEGRQFDLADGGPNGAIILDQSSAKALFPHDSPIGHSVKLADSGPLARWVPVVGVVRDASIVFNSEDQVDREPTVYVMLPSGVVDTAATRANYHIVVRPRSGSGDVAPKILSSLRATVGAGGAVWVEKWTKRFDVVLLGQRFVADVFLVIGMIALMLGGIGLFSVLAFVAVQRMREFAVRIALGARHADLIRLVLRQGAELAMFGIIIGGAAGISVARLLESQLYGLSPFDVRAMVIAQLVLLSVATIASLSAATRTLRANPVDILRAV